MKARLNARAIAVVLALGLTVSVGACSGSPDASQNPSTGSPSVASTVTPTNQDTAQPVDIWAKYDPPIEISTVKYQDDGTQFYDGDTFENNALTRGYLDQLGIKSKVLWSVPTSTYEQRLNTSIASGEIPDVFEVNNVQFAKLLDAGMLEDMTDVYAEYISPWAKTFTEGDGGLGLKIYTIGGRLMAIPRMDATYDTAPMLWIRTDWLKKLGLSVPKTPEELVKVAQAFTTQDPDGDGQNNTIGFAFEKALFGEFAVLNGFFNSYGAYATSWIKDGSGNLAFGGIQPEMRQALSDLAAMYQGGDIDKEFSVKDGSKIAELVAGGQLGMFYGQHWNAFWPIPDAKKNNLNAEWMPYPIPSPDGTNPRPEVKIGVKSAFVVRKGISHPEAVIKLLNFYLREDAISPDRTSVAYHQGYAMPDNPLKVDPSKPNPVGWKAATIFMGSPTQNIDIHNQTVKYLNTKDYTDLPWVKSSYTDNPESAEKVNAYREQVNNSGTFAIDDPAQIDAVYAASLWSGTKYSAYQVIADYLTKEEFVYPEFFGAPTPTMTSKQATLDKMQLEMITKIVMGAAPIEEFDKYVADWKALGGDDITREVNEWATARK